MGFKGNILNFIKSYLEDKYQSVHIGDFHSDYKKVKFGVPQGSILGPILFILFINDLLKIQCDFMTLFADDAVFGLKHRNFNDLIGRLNSFIGLLSSWLLNNNLFPNIQKNAPYTIFF